MVDEKKQHEYHEYPDHGSMKSAITLDDAITRLKESWKHAQEQKSNILTCVFQLTEEPGPAVTRLVCTQGGGILVGVIGLAECAHEQIDNGATALCANMVRNILGPGVKVWMMSEEERAEAVKKAGLEKEEKKDEPQGS